MLGQFNAEFGGDDHHASFGRGISYQGRKATETSELDVSTLTRNAYDLLLFAMTNEVKEGVDNEYVTDHVCFDLFLVSFRVIARVLAGKTHVLNYLLLQSLLLAMATLC
jgi:hypothetical protein